MAEDKVAANSVLNSLISGKNRRIARTAANTSARNLNRVNMPYQNLYPRFITSVLQFIITVYKSRRINNRDDHNFRL